MSFPDAERAVVTEEFVSDPHQESRRPLRGGKRCRRRGSMTSTSTASVSSSRGDRCLGSTQWLQRKQT